MRQNCRLLIEAFCIKSSWIHLGILTAKVLRYDRLKQKNLHVRKVALVKPNQTRLDAVGLQDGKPLGLMECRQCEETMQDRLFLNNLQRKGSV